MYYKMYLEHQDVLYSSVSVYLKQHKQSLISEFMNEKYTSYTIVVCRCDAVYDVWQIFEHSRDNPFCSMLITAEPGFGKTTLFNKIVSI